MPASSTSQIAVELDPAKRQQLINEATKIHVDEVGHIPVHQQVVVWAARQNISLQLMADNYFPLRYVRVQ